METKQTCKECNKEFTYNMKPGYPRKYCLECSEKKKAEFNKPKTESPILNDSPVFKTGAQLMSAKDIMIVAQCLTKVCYQGGLTYSAEDVLKTYRGFVMELEENG